MTSTAAFSEFREEQRFRQGWLWAVVLLSLLPAVGVFLYGMAEQLVFGRPWGDRPLSDTALVLVGIAFILLSVGVIWLLAAMRLLTEVRGDGLYLRFWPFIRNRTIPYPEIVSCQARTYRPIAEYGGWGVRYGFSRGWAYNVQGNRGVQLELRSGRKLLIGSQRAEELEAAIRHHLA